jgi:hypothetical protein
MQTQPHVTPTGDRMKLQSSSISLVHFLGAVLLVGAGCGGGSPAGTPGSAGSSGPGSGGTNGSGNGGTTGTGTAGTTGSGTAGSTGSGTGGSTGGVTGAGGIGKIPIGMTQCSDGKDNDGDGKIDYFDPECVGGMDNDESSFATGIPGDNMDACKQDCFFDGNSGAGDDHCDWQLKCDPASVNVKCPYDAQYAQSHAMECSTSSSQSQACINFCRKFVPNGCDCFGCCVVPGAPTPILLAATCTAADFSNPAKCPACTQVTQCSNPCERCEICLGKPTIPDDCRPDGGTPPPDGGGGCEGYQSCGPGTDNPDPLSCPTNTFCVTGCCLPTDPG